MSACEASTAPLTGKRREREREGAREGAQESENKRVRRGGKEEKMEGKTRGELVGSWWALGPGASAPIGLNLT